MRKYFKTAHMAYLAKTNGGILYLLPPMLTQVLYLIPLLYLWRVVLADGAVSEMTLPQMLTYTWLSTAFADLLVVRTPATGWLSEGVLTALYGRPLPVLGQLTAQTVGGWLPRLLFFSLPMTLAAPWLGVGLRPASPWFFASLLLCVSLGFAIDFIFACISLRLHNKGWLVEHIRMAVVSVLSGTVIPLRLMPYGVGQALQYQPFASMGGAPLSIFVGAAESPVQTVAVQCLWNVLLWAAALYGFHQSQEKMVSYGG